jgi:hypothetical protein
MFISASENLNPRRINADVAEAIAKISQDDLRGWVKWLSVPRHFTAQPRANQEAREWIAGMLREWGYEVRIQGPFSNVIALPRETDSPMVLIGAHYDSVGSTPGADDNASAVAAMLGCAKLFASLPWPPSVCFAAFNREEDDLAGSRDFVTNDLPNADFTIAAAHILEMVGYASSAPGTQRIPEGLPIKIPDVGNFIAVLANWRSNRHADAVLQTARSYLPEFPAKSLKVALGLEHMFPVLSRSDHAPFWAARIPALMWTDTSEYRNPHYHLPSDTPDTLDYTFLENVTKLLCAHLLNTQ